MVFSPAESLSSCWQTALPCPSPCTAAYSKECCQAQVFLQAGGQAKHGASAEQLPPHTMTSWAAVVSPTERPPQTTLSTTPALPHPCTDAVGSTGPYHDVLQTLYIAPGTSPQAPQIDYWIQHQLPWTMEGGLPSPGDVVNVNALLA